LRVGTVIDKLYIMAYSNDYKINTIKLYNDKIKFNFLINGILKIQNIARSTLYSWINDKNNIIKYHKLKLKRKNGKITQRMSKFYT
jgi:hypothetical protein